MYKLCVFAGTTEGRELVEFLSGQDVSVTVCVATEYGETLLPHLENLTVLTGRLGPEDMAALFERERFNCVVDATHPYAALVTEHIASACEKTGTDYLRLLREGGDAPGDAVYVADIPAAVEYLGTTQGNILLTTGSKELHRYTGLQDFASRVYARVLPMEDSLRACQDAGLKPAHILALQGPFSREMNAAMLRSTNARYLVTKEGGGPGGFEEKVRAARDGGAVLVVVGRPPQREGLDFSATVDLLCRRFGLTWRPQVALVGLGPGSREMLTGEASAAIHQADCLIGAGRMLEAVAAPGQAQYAAIAPQDIADFIKCNRQYRRFAVVLSGDVGFFSGAKRLLPLLSDCDTRCCPGLSSMVTLCARLGVDYEDVLPVSLHGRDRDIVPYVKTHRRVFALVGGEDGMASLCRRLTEAGLGAAKVSIGERLSYPDEKVTVGTAQDLASGSYQSLSVALIENSAAQTVVTHGLPDEAFLRGGDQKAVPMTKSEVRSVALSKLQLTEDAVCWDVGAGTGSVAIEMALQAKLGRVYAIERRSDAMDLLTENARRLGAENLEVISGTAPEVCHDLPAPTHVFLGGTAGNLREILVLLLEKNPQVRIVATAIALESVSELTEAMKEFSFREAEAVSLTVARARQAGPYHLMTGQNPIYIFTLQG